MFVISEEERVADIKRKIALIQTIIKKCEDLTNTPVCLQSMLAATMFFTNESEASIREAIKNPKARVTKSLIVNYHDLKAKIQQSDILPCHIHDILYTNYVEKRDLLNLETLYKDFKAYNVVGNVMDVLKGRGFVWKKLSGKKCVLIEDPQLQAKRIKYLLDVKKFREQNMTFVYVEEKAIPADLATLYQFQMSISSPNRYNQFPQSELGTYQYVKIAASPQLGVISLSINKKTETVYDWLMNEVAPHMKESCILVLDENMIKEAPINQPPKPEAKKNEMIEWLDRNNIPSRSTMHRAELYELIEMFRDKLNDKEYPFEEIFKGKGVKILKRPYGWPQLNYFEQIWHNNDLWNPIRGHGSIDETLAKRVTMLIDFCSLVTWEQYSNDLEVAEPALFEKDMELEEVVDKLFTMAKDVDMSDADLPHIWEVEASDMEKYVNIISGTFS